MQLSPLVYLEEIEVTFCTIPVNTGLLESRVLIPPRARILFSGVSVCCVGSGLCDELIICPEETYRVCVCVCVCF